MKLPSLIITLLATGSLFAAEPAKVYMIGNSLTDEVKYDAWAKLCKEAGSEVIVARKMIPGSPIGWHQEHPKDGFLTEPFGHPEEAFKNHPWDALTLQPFRSGEAEAALYYANLLWATNPKARVFVYAQWPSKGGDPDWIKAWEKIRDESYLPVVAALRETPQAAQVVMIPTGHAMERLHKKAQLGIVPGISSAWDIYSDGVHVNNIASYLVGLSFYATIFQKSPVGLPVGDYQGQKGSDADYFPISPELAKILQETVWEAVTAVPESGVVSDQPPALTLPALADAVQKEPYFFALDAAYGKPPYQYEMASGALPPGVSLNQEGLLSGTPESTTESRFSVRVKDSAGRESSRDYMLKTGADTAPKITTSALPALEQGRYVSLSLEAPGGNGVSEWSVSAGKLPPGLIIDKNGRLSGSPATAGAYEVTVMAKDSDGANPESDTKSFTGTISPANPESVLLVRRATAEPKLDGVLDPAEGWVLKTELKKTYAGTPNNKVRFDAQWFKDKVWFAVEVEDDGVISEEGWNKPRFTTDSLVFYFDGLNNREATYNFDDRRLAYGPVEQGPEDRTFNIGPFMPMDVKFTRTEKGYIMEGFGSLDRMAVPKQNEDPKRWDNPDAYAGAVFGFDLENRDIDTDGDEPSSLGWQGTAKNPEDASHFGTIILVP